MWKLVGAGLEEYITRFKSTSVFGTDFSANSKPRLQRLTDSIVGIHESNISPLRSSDIMITLCFLKVDDSHHITQPLSSSSKGHNFTDPSINLSAISSYTWSFYCDTLDTI